ncbi:zinc ribbon domain-containing protein [Paenibacillus sp. UMB4589-SE434]|uniref:double zinc ribbon domain-containing protein n=1 Tax=Paenibacillus sp. UMB4589-SE434 TaxID=3046314 RepID=UPI00254D6B42|nr:zinc ribbon domain-containing protein [Paenibacillus sp. UMB4589-SE434]MDK8183464.1 zinc ribbon domain-containing protein [Paenibacillus sp. UMB4589-SE434]
MSFFDKMKSGLSSGLSQVKDKAQQTVEVTRLYSTISTKRKDIQQRYGELGELVYRASGAGKGPRAFESEAEAQMARICEEIAKLEIEVEQLEEDMHRVKGEKVCSCGTAAPLQSKFCSRCGKSFPTPVLSDPIDVEPVDPARSSAQQYLKPYEEVRDQVGMEKESITSCAQCGQSLTVNDRFCITCGKPQG